MAADACKTLELIEYQPRFLPKDALPTEIGEAIFRQYGSMIEVIFPSLATEGRWRLTSLGWVGHLPVTYDFALSIRPKVPLLNLFRMWEYAYNLQSFQFLQGLNSCGSIDELFDHLASILAKKVLDRGRKGLYRAYDPRQEQLPYARGRLDVAAALRRPWEPYLPWHYEEHTADITDNRILAWTLHLVSRSGLCHDDASRNVRRANHLLQSAATLEAFVASDCLGRLYHRLNEDYQPLHAFCRFFLDHCGPLHQTGDKGMLPFQANMSSLFEAFVAAWLQPHLPDHLVLRRQETIYFTGQAPFCFRLDLVLCERATNRPVCIMDTKYKGHAKPQESDIQQVVAYAHSLGCREAILIYPRELEQPIDAVIGETHVRALTFALEGDLEMAGERLLSELGTMLAPTAEAVFA